MVSPRGIDAMLIADHFPELQTQNGRYHMTLTCNESTHLPIRFAVHGIGGWGVKMRKTAVGLHFCFLMEMTGFFHFSASHI